MPMTDTSELSPLEQWSTLIRNPANTAFGDVKPKRLASTIAAAVTQKLLRQNEPEEAAKLSESMVKQWLSGEAVPPSRAVLEAFLETINLGENKRELDTTETPKLSGAHAELAALFGEVPAESDTPQYKPLSGAAQRRLEARETLLSLYEALPSHLKDTAASQGEVQTKPEKPTAPTRSAQKGTIAAYLPDPAYSGDIRYAGLTHDRLVELLSETPNVPEFLRLYRYLHKPASISDLKSVNEFAEAMNITPEMLTQLETGKLLPDADVLQAYVNYMHSHNDDTLYGQLEQRCISNLLDVSEGLTNALADGVKPKERDHYLALLADTKAKLPAAYWRTLIEYQNHISGSQQDVELPVWAEQRLAGKPLLKEEYLRASRGASGMSIAEASQKFGYSSKVIEAMEGGTKTPNGNDAVNLFCDYREKLKGSVHLDFGVYDGLATAYKREKRSARAEEPLSHADKIKAEMDRLSSLGIGPTRR
jgi:transcriptional regulator with XRE-family HTH domain